MRSPANGKIPSDLSATPAVFAPRDQRLLHDSNLGLVARTIFAAPQPITRAAITERTGMTRATVFRLVEELIDAKLVEQLAPLRSPQQGRPPNLLLPHPGTIAGVGLEVNVDLIAGRALDLSGRTLCEFASKGSFSNSDPSEVLAQLSELTSVMLEELDDSEITPAGVCLAIPGVVDHSTGFLYDAPNLGWSNVGLNDLVTETLQSKLGVPVQVWNDADQQAICAAYKKPGLLEKPSTFLYVAGDSGIGGALVYDGQVAVGVHGAAGEIGHLCVDPSGPECFCGSRGCLERYAGRTAILTASGLDPTRHTTEDLIALLEADNSRALQAVFAARNALSIAIGNAVNLLDIPTVVVGTGLGQLLPWMEPDLSQKVTQMVIGKNKRELLIKAGTAEATPACTGGAIVSLLGPINDPAGWINSRRQAS